MWENKYFLYYFYPPGPGFSSYGKMEKIKQKFLYLYFTKYYLQRAQEKYKKYTLVFDGQRSSAAFLPSRWNILYTWTGDKHDSKIWKRFLYIRKI